MNAGQFLRPTTEDDVHYIAPRLRAADAREIRSVSGMSPLASMALGFVKSSICLTLTDFSDGERVGILGVVPVGSYPREGLVWMHCTEALPSKSMKFLRHSKEGLRLIFREYDILYNWVDKRNELHVKWLKWMGFHFINIQNIGVEGIPAYHFVATKEGTCV